MRITAVMSENRGSPHRTGLLPAAEIAPRQSRRLHFPLARRGAAHMDTFDPKLRGDASQSRLLLRFIRPDSRRRVCEHLRQSRRC